MLMILYSFIYILIRIFVFAKIFSLLCLTQLYPETYDITELTWWIYFIIFDTWIMNMLPDKIKTKD